MKRFHFARELALDLLFDFGGCAVFAVAIQCFSAPNNIAPGGVSGISILINYLTELPISLLSFGINIPLLCLAWFFLGRRFTLVTLKTVAIMSLLLELGSHLPVYQGNAILAALYGGVLEGLGLSIVFLRGSTTGGTDVASRLIQLRFPYVSVGKLMLMVDGCVLLMAAFVYRNIENALYGLIAIYTSTHIIDSILYGRDMGKVLLIISKQYQEIAKAINEQMVRGCTVLSAKGSYTWEERPVLLCAVRKPQVFEVKRLVRGIDPTAFLLALEADEVIGEGFNEIGS